jgi:hypothetical protein
MDRRTEPRVRQRMECELRFAGVRRRGVVVDASPRGLFVRTGAKPTSAGELEIRVCLPGRRDATRLRAAPVRMQLAPARGTGASRCEVGLRVVEAPQSYATFFHSVATEERLPDRRTSAQCAPLRERRSGRRSSADGSRFESRPAPAPTLVLDEEVATREAAVPELPMLQMPARPRCGRCRRDDRPLLAGVCTWCHGHERG